MKISALTLVALLYACGLFAGEATLAIDRSRSHVEAMVRSSLENFTASLTAYEALISVDVAEKRIVNAQLKFRVADVKTGSEKRDADMGRWEQTDQFPECVYILDALLPAAGGTFKARGKLILHGVTQELVFPVTISFKAPNVCSLDGDLTLNTTDFGLPQIRKFGLFKVNPELQVKFHLEGRAASEN